MNEEQSDDTMSYSDSHALVSEELSYKKIFSFWSPLALTWAMMAIEGPVLNSVVSRLPEQRDNLAAYGLATSIAMIIESPIIMMLSAAVALVRDEQSFQALRRYCNRLNFIVTALMVVAIIPPVHHYIAHDLLSLPDSIADKLYTGLACLIFWPACIGYRRLYQGIMIRNSQTREVALGSIARISSMLLFSFGLAAWTALPGVVVGSLSLAAGVFFEAIATRRMARTAVHVVRSNPASSMSLSPAGIRRFYRPLALTSMLGMAVNPMLAFFMSRFPNMLESLAVFPIIDSFVFQFRSPGFSFQEVGIALLDNTRLRLRKIRNFGIALMLITSSLLAVFAFSPLLNFVYTQFPYKLIPELASFAIAPTMCLVLLPALSVLYSFQRSVLIQQHKTHAVSISTFVEVSCIFLVLVLEMFSVRIPGALAVSIALIVGRIIANIYLARSYRIATRNMT